MSERKLSDEVKDTLGKFFDYGQEEFNIIESNPRQFDIVTSLPALLSKKMVVTCVETENCGCHKVGDRYVFNASGFLIKDETCEMPCLWAMGNFFPYQLSICERAASGLDLEGLHFDHFSYPDIGCKSGGLGKALFKITIETA